MNIIFYRGRYYTMEDIDRYLKVITVLYEDLEGYRDLTTQYSAFVEELLKVQAENDRAIRWLSLLLGVYGVLVTAFIVLWLK